IRTIEADWNTFSSARGITLGPPAGTKIPESIERVRMFIAMDPPEHTQQRKTVRDVAALDNVRNLEPLTRERMGDLLDSLPEDETFDWVPTVSKELTAMMLATLFGIPHEDRHKLIRWSDVATSIPEPGGVVESGTQRREELMECLDYFTAQWERRQVDPGYDLVSMLVHGDATKHLSPLEQLGNLMLLIVGGNDTTRNTMSGSVYALNRFPEQYDRLLADHSLVEGLVPEIIRWQTPLAYMRRTATTDTEFLGRKIAKGEQVLLWYVSANRDESFFDDPDSFDLTRENARRHLSFGTSIHHCMGNRVAEMQIRVLWEEILKRFSRIEVVHEPERTFSSFINGYVHLPVRVHRN
ncbi:MAG: cytochrome P450, partial [Actinomycetota bacterium]